MAVKMAAEKFGLTTVFILLTVFVILREKIKRQHINYTNKQFCNQSPKKLQSSSAAETNFNEI